MTRQTAKSAASGSPAGGGGAVNEDAKHAFYLYGFAQADFAPEPTAATPDGIAGSPALDGSGIGGEQAPFLWRHAGSAAILNRVLEGEFCGPAADSNLQNLAWVSPRVLRHQSVLQWAMHSSPILPARFGTLFSSLAALGRLMEQHRQTIARFLKRVARQEEWAVKGLLDRAQAEAGLMSQKQTAQGGTPAASPGLAYLLEQQSRKRAKAELEQRLAGVCDCLLDELTPLASEACSREVLGRELTGAPQEIISNWAFLVPQRAVAAFRQRVEQANAHPPLPGLAFALSGPWPPYSFCPKLE